MATRDQAALPQNVRSALELISSDAWEGYLESPLPSDPDARVAVLVERYAEADEGLRGAIRRGISPPQSRTLSVFAVRMAMLAVREVSVRRLRLGLQAAALASGGESGDWRDASEILHPLSDAAMRIGADAQREFADAAPLAGPHAARLIENFPPRRAWHRLVERAASGLGLGAWKATVAPDGFRYVPTHPATKEEVDRIVRTVSGRRRNEPPRG